MLILDLQVQLMLIYVNQSIIQRSLLVGLFIWKDEDNEGYVRQYNYKGKEYTQIESTYKTKKPTLL